MAFEIGERVTNPFMGHGTVVGSLEREEDIEDGRVRVTYSQRVKFDNPIMGERSYLISKLNTLDPAVESGISRAVRIPRSLRILPTKGSYQDFIEYLRTSEAKCSLTLEAQCPEMDFAVRQQYTKITGEQLIAGKGYNVAPHTAKKQGCEGSVSFVVPQHMPDDLAGMMKQRPGLINRIEVVWMLIENGFRVTR